MMAELGENTHVYCLLPLINNNQISKLLGHSVWIKEEEKNWRRKKSFPAQSYTTHVWLPSILPLNWAYNWGRYKTRICPLEGLNVPHIWHIVFTAVQEYKQELAEVVPKSRCRRVHWHTLDIVRDTFRSLVLISEMKECVTQTLQILKISRDSQTCALCCI